MKKYRIKPYVSMLGNLRYGIDQRFLLLPFLWIPETSFSKKEDAVNYYNDLIGDPEKIEILPGKQDDHVKSGVTIILINKKSQVLIGKRKGSHGAGLYSIPGGHIEFGETYAECCSRELMEEIGTSFPSYEKVGFSEDFFYPENKNHTWIKKHYTTLYFAVKNIDSDSVKITNMEPHKCEGWEWVDIDKLPNLMFCDTYNQIKKTVRIDK